MLTDLYFGAAHVLLLKQELPVQVAHIDGVQVHLYEMGVVYRQPHAHETH